MAVATVALAAHGRPIVAEAVGVDSPAGVAEAVAVGAGSCLLSLCVTGLDHVLLVRAV